jgi:glycosyltransferase involved in cell wall biosynthesis
MKQLSILIPTLPQRLTNYNSLLNIINNQVNSFNLKDKVQILSILDTKEMTVGEKRNWLLKMSNGKYVQFVDDDDRLANDFVKKMYEATLSGADIVTFRGEYHESGIFHSEFIISTMVKFDSNVNGMMYRKPNHLCPVKREIAIKCIFPNKNFGEDSEYANQINNHIKNENHINEKMYFYMFDKNNSQTHNYK